MQINKINYHYQLDNRRYVNRNINNNLSDSNNSNNFNNYNEMISNYNKAIISFNAQKLT